MKVSVSAALLLVDDDEELAELMREFFVQNSFSIDIAPDSVNGLQQALSGRYDLIILDVMMPRMDGFEFLKRLRAESQTPVLMLTARTDRTSRIAGLDSGADDYLPKPFDPQELLARVRAILRRVKPAGSTVVECNGVRLDPASRSVFRDNTPVDVTSVEYDILEVLMRAAGRVVSRDELTQRLYQRDATPFDRSIDVHVSHLRRKLESPNGARGAVIRTVRGVGYQFCLETPA